MDEFKLAKKLKKQCFLNGREINSAKSAHLIHKIGCIYAKKGDRISIIQSAALLNAALVRNPKNKDIEVDISKLCFELVSKARPDIDTKDIDLVKATQVVRQGVEKMRSNANNKLKELNFISEDTADPKEFEEFKKQKISTIREIQLQVALDYKEIMKNLCDYCVSILGGAPCKFALIALGSMARNEITPYSDFENIIVLEEDIQNSPQYESVLEFFRWYAVIFQVVLINLGETIIPCVGVPCLNDINSPTCEWFYDAYTPRGVSFDGMVPHACKSPLGRPFKTEKKDFEIELIKPVSLMAKYIDAEEDLKNGYHLADMLKTSCFVAGDEEICNDFQDLIKQKLANVTRGHQKEIVTSIKDQVKKNLHNFSIEKSLDDLNKKHSFNIKSLLYRSSTVFISAMGKLSELEASSCFNIIDTLPYPELTDVDRLNLKFAVAVSCEARLKIYAQNNSQNDNFKVTSIGTEFVKVLGLKTLVEYFLIVSTMQNNIFIKNKDFEVSSNQVPKMLHHLQQYQIAIDAAHSLLKIEKMPILYHMIAISYYELDKYVNAIKALELGLELVKKFKARQQREQDTVTYLTNMGLCYSQMKQHQKGINYFHKAVRLCESFSTDASADETIASLYFNIGVGYLFMTRYVKAIGYYKKAFAINQNLRKVGKTWYLETDLLNDMGICYARVHRYEDSVAIGRLALKLRQTLTLDEAFDEKVSFSFNNIGLSLKNLGRYKEAAENYENMVKILKKNSVDIMKNPDIAEGYLDIGICYSYHGDTVKAIESFKKSIAIRLKGPNGKGKLTKLNDLYYNLGVDHLTIQNFPAAEKYILKALKIRKSLTSNCFKDEKICGYYSTLGNCFFERGMYKMANILYAKSIQIRETLALESPDCIEGCPDRIAGCYQGVANCEYEQGFYCNALFYLKTLIKIRKGDSKCTANDLQISELYVFTGHVYKKLNRFRKATWYYKQALRMQYSLPKHKVKNVAFLGQFMKDCHERLRKSGTTPKYNRHSTQHADDKAMVRLNDICKKLYILYL